MRERPPKLSAKQRSALRHVEKKIAAVAVRLGVESQSPNLRNFKVLAILLCGEPVEAKRGRPKKYGPVWQVHLLVADGRVQKAGRKWSAKDIAAVLVKERGPYKGMKASNLRVLLSKARTAARRNELNPAIGEIEQDELIKRAKTLAQKLVTK